jgi:hypothetical protein
MSRSYRAGLVPVLTVIAFALAAPAAQASEPHWYRCEEVSGGTLERGCTSTGTGGFSKILVGASPGTAITTEAVLTMKIGASPALECNVTDEGHIWNPGGGGAGEDSVTAFNLACGGGGCSKPELKALSLPWKSVLQAGPPITNLISGIEIEVKCSGVFVEDVFGHLAPEVVNGVPTVMKFTTGTGDLTDARKDVITVQGEDAIEGPPGVGILATTP